MVSLPENVQRLLFPTIPTHVNIVSTVELEMILSTITEKGLLLVESTFTFKK